MKKLFTALLLMLSTLAFSQIDIDTFDLEEVVIDGNLVTKYQPQTVTDVSPVQLNIGLNGQSVPQLLDRLPNVTSSTDGGANTGYAYFRLRGMDQTRINMSLGGVPLNDLEDQGVYFSNMPGFMYNMNSIQMQRGVGMSKFGTASWAGSLDLNPKRGLEQEAGVTLGNGSFNQNLGSAYYGSGLMGKTSVYFRTTLVNSDGYRYNSATDGGNIFVSGGYWGEKSQLKWMHFQGRSYNQMAWYGVAESDLNIDRRTSYNTNNEFDYFTQNLTSVQWSRQWNNFSLNVTPYVNNINGDWRLDLGSNSILNFGLNQRWKGINTDFKTNIKTIDIWGGLGFSGYEREHIGSEVLGRTWWNNTGYRNVFNTWLKAQYERNGYLFYSDIQYRNSKFTYDGAVEMNDLMWEFVNYKVGVSKNINNYSNLYASLGRSGREPTRTDLFGGEDDLIELNRVSPEYVSDLEFGWRRYKEKSTFKLNFYYMQFQNEIVLLGALGTNALPLTANVESSYRSGIEGEYSRSGKFGGIDAWAFVSRNNILSDVSTFQPILTPTWGSFVRLYVGNKLQFGVESRTQSSMYLDWDNNFKLDPWSLTNLYINIDSKRLNTRFRLNNVFNENYYTNGYMVDRERHLYVNPLRNFWIEFTYKI